MSATFVMRATLFLYESAENKNIHLTKKKVKIQARVVTQNCLRPNKRL